MPVLVLLRVVVVVGVWLLAPETHTRGQGPYVTRRSMEDGCSLGGSASWVVGHRSHQSYHYASSSSSSSLCSLLVKFLRLKRGPDHVQVFRVGEAAPIASHGESDFPSKCFAARAALKLL